MNHSLFVNPDQVIEPIGCYQECQIYRFAIVNGTTYRFDHILPAGTVPLVGEDRCCLAPGLVYVAGAAQHADSRGNNPSKWNAKTVACCFSLTCSKKQTAAHAATFRDSISPRCGMATVLLARASNASETPCPSMPNIPAPGRRKSAAYNSSSACVLVASTELDAVAIALSNSMLSKISSTKCAPIPARKTLGDHAN